MPRKNPVFATLFVAVFVLVIIVALSYGSKSANIVTVVREVEVTRIAVETQPVLQTVVVTVIVDACLYKPYVPQASPTPTIDLPPQVTVPSATPTQVPPIVWASPTPTEEEHNPPTATAVPPTVTLIPPTATQVPPTATSVPPTATSVPPTSTPVPPTDVPEPTPTCDDAHWWNTPQP